MAIAIAVALFSHRSDAFKFDSIELLELSTLDTRFRTRGPRPTSGNVVLLAFDDATLERAPHLYERRSGQAEVITAAAAAGVKVLGVDLLYTDPEARLEPQLIEDIDRYLDSAETPLDPVASGLLVRVQEEVHGDEQLTAAIKAADNVVLSFHVGVQGNLPGNDRSLAKGKYGQVGSGPELPQASGRVLASMAMFNRKAERLGLMGMNQDISGTARRISLAQRLDASVFAPLAVALVAEFDDVNRAKVAVIGTDDTVHIGDRVIQAEQGHLRLNWRGRRAFPQYSVVDLVEGKLPPDALSGKIAVLGFSHLGQDSVRTPFGRGPGPAVHATAVDNILMNDALKRADPVVDALLSLVTGAFIALLFVPRRIHRVLQVVASCGVLGAILGAVFWVFASQNLWLSAVGPAMAGTGALLAAMGTAYWYEGRQQAELRATFSRYLSKELVDELVEDPSRVALKGERMHLSVLFTDIRDFTSFSERTDPEELRDFLNAYFTPMTQAVMRNGGYVDKFIGDAVMAIFGAPVPRTRHALHACVTAIDMFHALDHVRVEATKRNITLDIGAGINTGEMIVGNMGSNERFDYTVLGDAVNLAARIEGLTKRYGVFCLVGPQTSADAEGCTFRPIDLVRVKGKGEPVEIFELCAGPTRSIAEYVELDAYSEGLLAWRAGRFDDSVAAFTQFQDANPHDKVAGLYLERIAKLGSAPEGWEGVFTYTEK